MTPICILIAGTHGFDEDWWKPDSDFASMLFNHRIRVSDQEDPYEWSTTLDGVFGKNIVWETSGNALRWYAQAKTQHYPISAITHSHGGQVAAYAAASGVHFDRLVTCAMPVRDDMDEIYAKAKKNIGRWTHIHSDVDVWQILGALRDGKWGVHRALKYADTNITVPGLQHRDFVKPDIWEDNAWWAYVK